MGLYIFHGGNSNNLEMIACFYVLLIWESNFNSATAAPTVATNNATMYYVFHILWPCFLVLLLLSYSESALFMHLHFNSLGLSLLPFSPSCSLLL